MAHLEWMSAVLSPFYPLSEAGPGYVQNPGPASSGATIYRVLAEEIRCGAVSSDDECSLPPIRADAPTFHLKNRSKFGISRYLDEACLLVSQENKQKEHIKTIIILASLSLLKKYISDIFFTYRNR